ncbi:Nmad5 family putative nucleotide modification protein, partial [Xenorhabdus bovienii]|uniref:Nmad5 family putative nucleotide modification protein n=1 Tax=Xenorhabdus bovienii TaxID=40576 RepID=UPI003DA38430
MTQKTLTKEVKSLIVKNALAKAKIFKKEEQLYKDRADWAEKIRIEAIGGAHMDAGIKDIMSEIKTLAAKIPEPLRVDDMPVREAIYIEINLAGVSVVAYFNGARQRYHYLEKRDHIYKITPKNTTLLA